MVEDASENNPLSILGDSLAKNLGARVMFPMEWPVTRGSGQTLGQGIGRKVRLEGEITLTVAIKNGDV